MLKNWYAHLILLACTAPLLVGCNSFPSKNQDSLRNNQEEFRKDLRECKEDYPESGSGVHYIKWADCMNLKGWK